MQIKDLIPWGREHGKVSRHGAEGDSPIVSLQRDLNRVFDDFWSRFDRALGSSNGLVEGRFPRADVTETDEAVEIELELPGMDEKDIEVSMTGDILTVRGEKKTEKEDRKRGYYMSERSYGSFYRMIPLPPGVDTDKAEATFKKGVLTISLPKTEEAKAKVKRIDVKAA